MQDDTTFVSLEEEFSDDPEYALLRTADRIVDRICIAMEQQGVSQSELARRVGVSRQHISAFIADPGNPTLRTIVEMAHALGLRVEIELVPTPDATAENEAATVAQAEA
jgi:transcriptional regulator with XRE-family HTH domain